MLAIKDNGKLIYLSVDRVCEFIFNFYMENNNFTISDFDMVELGNELEILMVDEDFTFKEFTITHKYTKANANDDNGDYYTEIGYYEVEYKKQTEGEKDGK